jgi:excisionase family DNA binding protein
MDTESENPKPKWYSTKEAAEYLDVGEPTIYRWMREGRITYRKVGDSTRFWREDLDAVMQVFRSDREVEKVEACCPFCHHEGLVEGQVQSTGACHFRPKKTKFWTLLPGNIATRASMCPRCGGIFWFGDKEQLQALRQQGSDSAEEAGSPVAGTTG